MLVCPKCNAEYEDWCKICSDCQCELIEKPEANEEDIPIKVEIKPNKSTISILLILGLFLCGCIISFIGLTKGLDIAGILSKPKGAIGWTIPDRLILGCTYTPVIIGVSLILSSISLSTALFINWINKST